MLLSLITFIGISTFSNGGLPLSGQILSRILASEILQENIVSEPIININIYTAKLMLILVRNLLIFINISIELPFLSSIKVIIIKVYKNYTINAFHFVFLINN
jgi:hypothetical protein